MKNFIIVDENNYVVSFGKSNTLPENAIEFNFETCEDPIGSKLVNNTLVITPLCVSIDISGAELVIIPATYVSVSLIDGYNNECIFSSDLTNETLELALEEDAEYHLLCIPEDTNLKPVIRKIVV